MKRDKDDFGPLLTPTEFMATLPQFPDTDMADWLLSLMTENYHTERQFWSLIKAEADKHLSVTTVTEYAVQWDGHKHPAWVITDPDDSNYKDIFKDSVSSRGAHRVTRTVTYTEWKFES